MTFRKVEYVTVECDGGCGTVGPARRQPEEAEAAAAISDITPIRFNPQGRHLCADCRTAIAKEQSK